MFMATIDLTAVREGRVPQLDNRRAACLLTLPRGGGEGEAERALNEALREFISEHVGARVARLKETPPRLMQVLFAIIENTDSTSIGLQIKQIIIYK
jgi:hypothetical protein